jgi:hypothetical protein
MYTTKSIGIWMDHVSAHLIEFRNLRVETVILRAKIKEKHKYLQTKEETSDENDQQQNYFKKIFEHIMPYENILIFGPNEEKNMFENYLLKQENFDCMKVVSLIADKMTDNHKHAFVNNYFKTIFNKKQ